MAGAMLYSPAAVADWHTPYVHRESHDEWTNVHYDDGMCEYRYSYNAEDRNSNVERWGDCSHIIIGPGGVAAPAVAAPGAVVPVYPAPPPVVDDGE
jgi:hypothetical protein